MKFALDKSVSKFRIFVILVIVASVAVFGYRSFVVKDNKRTRTAKVARGDIRQEMILSGKIEAREHARLTFLSSGKLDYIGVSEGQRVKKGEVLARLDAASAYQALLQAESDLRRYQATLDRIYDEIKGHDNDETFAQREERTIAESNKDKAYRAYLIAKNNLANLSLRAPFDGIVTSLTYPFGGINTSLAESQIEIVNPETVYFSALADQVEVVSLKVGQKAKVVLDSFPQRELDGEIEFIGYTPKSGEGGIVYEVRVKLTGLIDIKEVRIGMSGDARFVIDEKVDVLYVPPSFINVDANGKYIKVGNANHKEYIETGLGGEEKIEIKGNIKEGDIIYD